MTNQAADKVLEVPRDAAIGRHFIEAVRDYEVDALLQQCLEKKEQRTGLVEVRSRKRLLGVIATPFPEEAGCLLLIQDLTELRKLETVRRDFIANCLPRAAHADRLAQGPGRDSARRGHRAAVRGQGLPGQDER